MLQWCNNVSSHVFMYRFGMIPIELLTRFKKSNSRAHRQHKMFIGIEEDKW